MPGGLSRSVVVPTPFFRLLCRFVILGHERRRLLGFGITSHLTAEWFAGQVTEAFPWDQAPRYLICDRDCVYGQAFTRRVRAMAFVIVRLQPVRPGRMDMQSG
jgi:hypothetical protein